MTLGSENFGAAYERVLTALKIWKPGERCEYWQGTFIAEFKTHTCWHGNTAPHNISLPVLTDEIAWQVLIAARKKHILRDFLHRDPDEKRALILALADVLP